MPKATQILLHRPKAASEFAAAAFVLVVISACAALLTLWIGMGR